MKTMILVGVTIGGLIGGWLGSLFDHGNPLGAWGLLLGTVGSFVGIWAAIKIDQYM
jgi:uncharacterized membrane protein YeaQ/YmgE (transglycosylase-associated protein family)